MRRQDASWLRSEKRLLQRRRGTKRILQNKRFNVENKIDREKPGLVVESQPHLKRAMGSRVLSSWRGVKRSSAAFLESYENLNCLRILGNSA